MQPPLRATLSSMVVPLETTPLPALRKHPPFSPATFCLQITSLNSIVPDAYRPNTCAIRQCPTNGWVKPGLQRAGCWGVSESHPPEDTICSQLS